MSTIWKYAVQVDDTFTLPLPKGAKVLTVMTQFERPYIWVEVDPGAPPEPRAFAVYPTGGMTIPEPQRYIGSFQLNGGALVFHLYEGLNP